MSRPRKSNRHLPQRVYHHHNAYFFVDHMGVWHRLGSSLTEMYQSYAEFLEERPVRTMADLFDRYMVEVVPKKAPRTQKDNAYEMRYLRAALAKMDPKQFKPRHGYAYYNTRKEKSLRREWSPELRRVVKRALSLPPHVRQPLICNKQGKAYTVDGFNSIWYRRIRAAIADNENPLE